MSKYILASLFIVLSFLGVCQDQNLNLEKSEKGKLYFYWGWNRGAFTKSDINFTGDHYDFTLSNVSASDRQSKVSAKYYLGLKTLSIPQYNARVGYYFKNNWDISLGVDHMKYVVDQNQSVLISGFIEDTNTSYDNEYQNNKIEIEKGFLELEHTDGLNFLNIDLRHSFSLIEKGKIKISTTEGAGLGVLMPKTNATLLNKERHDDFHLAGYGVSTVLGLNLTFYNRFFIQSELKGGYINMPDVRTSPDKNDRASHSFFFAQYNILFGAYFNLNRN